MCGMDSLTHRDRIGVGQTSLSNPNAPSETSPLAPTRRPTPLWPPPPRGRTTERPRRLPARSRWTACPEWDPAGVTQHWEPQWPPPLPLLWTGQSVKLSIVAGEVVLPISLYGTGCWIFFQSVCLVLGWLGVAEVRHGAWVLAPWSRETRCRLLSDPIQNLTGRCVPTLASVIACAGTFDCGWLGPAVNPLFFFTMQQSISPPYYIMIFFCDFWAIKQHMNGVAEGGVTRAHFFSFILVLYSFVVFFWFFPPRAFWTVSGKHFRLKKLNILDPIFPWYQNLSIWRHFKFFLKN